MPKQVPCIYAKPNLICVLNCSVMFDSLWFPDCSLLVSCVHGISQARILEWVAISYCRGSSRARDRTHVSGASALVSRFFTTKTPGKLNLIYSSIKNKHNFSFFQALKHFLSTFYFVPSTLKRNIISISLPNTPYEICIIIPILKKKNMRFRYKVICPRWTGQEEAGHEPSSAHWTPFY